MILNEDVFLEHYGVKGMKWGHRKNSLPGVSHRTNREARRDAEEHAAAKMYFGKGAGTRRKLIKATVEAKSKQDPAYKKAFEHHLSKQDMSTHAQKARTQRKRTDRKEGTAQTIKAVARQITNSQGTKAAFVALALGGAAWVRSPQGQRKMQQATKFAAKAANEAKRRQGAAKVAKILKDLS